MVYVSAPSTCRRLSLMSVSSEYMSLSDIMRDFSTLFGVFRVTSSESRSLPVCVCVY